MEKHVIICGFGIVGRKIADTLNSKNIPFIIVDMNPEHKLIIDELGYKMVTGDATSAKTLINADIEKASALVAAIDNDAKNLFTILTAKKLNKKIFIATRTKDEMVMEKLKEAGANYVVDSFRSTTEQIMMEINKE